MIRRSSLAVAGVALLWSCDDVAGPVTSAPEVTSQLVKASNPGVAGFHFLQPLAGNPVFSGVFDGSLSPTVDICLPAGQGCSLPLIARYTMTSGVGSEVIKVGASQYFVNWQTKQFRLTPSTVYRIRVSVGTTALGYTDVTVVNNASSSIGGTAMLVSGSTLPIRFRIEVGAVPPVGATRALLLSGEAVTSSIGAAGGSITLTSRGIVYTLSIPARALLEMQSITLTPLSGMTNFPLSGGLAAGVNFAPEGLVFYKPATLTMAFPGSSNLEQVYGFGYVADGAEIYLKLDSKNGTSITIPVTHFSGAGAGAASIVDIEALINSVSVGLPSELYPTVMKQAQVQLSQQICGGPDVQYACIDSQTEMDSYQAAWFDVAEEVLLRWYNDRLKDLLAGATASDGSLSRATDEYAGGWKASLALLYDVNPPATLAAKLDEGDLLLATAYQASLERARQNCADSTALNQFGKIGLLSLEGSDLGNGRRLPADIDELQSRNTCTSFRKSGLPARMVRDAIDTMRVEVLRTVGSGVARLQWPEPITFQILPTANGTVCGSIESSTSFSDMINPNSGDLDVTISTESMPGSCREVAIEIATPYYAPASDPPPGLFSRAVFGATDTLRIPVDTTGITITPAMVIISPGATQQFTATVTGVSNSAVTWAATAGTISSAGVLTAGSTPGTFTVTATSVDNPAQSASAQVTIFANTTVTVSPGSAIVAPGGFQQFTATVTGTSNQAVNWTATGGTITGGGLYRAFAVTGGPFTVTASSQANPSVTGTATVTVTAPQAAAVLVSNNCRVYVDGSVELQTNSFDRQFLPFTQEKIQEVGFSSFSETVTAPELKLSNSVGSVSASGSAQQTSTVTAGSATGTIASGSMSGEARHDMRDDTDGGTARMQGMADCTVTFDVMNGPIVVSLNGNLMVQHEGEELGVPVAQVELIRSGCGLGGCGGAIRYSVVGSGSQSINESVTLSFGRWSITFSATSLSTCCSAQDGISNGTTSGSLSFSFSQPR